MQNTQLNQDLAWKSFFMLSFAFIVIFFADSAFAAAADPDPLTKTMCRVVDFLTGSIAKAVATIAIFVVGAGLFTGKLNWMLALTVSLGIGIVFGAPAIVKLISGQDASGSCGNIKAGQALLEYISIM